MSKKIEVKCSKLSEIVRTFPPDVTVDKLPLKELSVVFGQEVGSIIFEYAGINNLIHIPRAQDRVVELGYEDFDYTLFGMTPLQVFNHICTKSEEGRVVWKKWGER